MKFIVMSDVHYVSPEIICPGAKDHSREDELVSSQALADAAAIGDCDTLLITGDLTDRGDRKSHLALIEKLRAVKAAGKRVCVTTATHDFNHHKAYTRRRGDVDVSFKESPWDMPYFDKEGVDYRSLAVGDTSALPDDRVTPQLEECCDPEELWELYREFGRDDAVSVCPSAYSYCVELDDKTLCLMLNDNFRNEEALHDISVTYSPVCLKWIAEMVKKAEDEGKFIFACTHHPLLPPSPAYRLGAGDRDMRSPYSAHVLADIGVSLVFTGHTHFADIGFAKSKKGSVLCDITTPSVRFFPPKFRLVELDGARHTVKTDCVEVSIPDGVDTGGLSLKEYYRKRMLDEYLGKVERMKPPLNKLLLGVRVKDVAFLVGGAGKIGPGYDKIKDEKLFNIVMSLAFNMLDGDGAYTPDTPEFRLMTRLAALADSVIDAQPFVDLRKKLGGYKAVDIVEPLCFNNGVSDNSAEFDFTVIPEGRLEVPKAASYAGDVIMAALCFLMVPIAPLLPYAAVAALPLMTIKKKLRLKKKPEGPKYIY